MPSIHTPPMRTTGGPPWGLPRSFWKTGNMSLHDVRRDYSGDVLPQDLTSFDPWEFFTSWLETAIAADEVEPNAMLLATIGSDGRPRSRVVLLKETSCNGLVFFTHYISPKGEQLAANPVASATFWWPQLMRQVRAVGAVTKLTRQENETYFAKRPRNSQLGRGRPAIRPHRLPRRPARGSISGGRTLRGKGRSLPAGMGWIPDRRRRI